MNTSINNGEYAIAYGQLGFQVLPLWWPANGRCACPDPECRPGGKNERNVGKHPIGELVPRGALSATSSAANIASWWGAHPQANIGLALAGAVALDVDPRNGGSVEALPDCWQDTLNATTGGGGVHAVFKLPKGRKARPVGKGIDVKSGAGSYIVAEPSIHASGGRYGWQDWSPADGEVPVIFDLPESFLKAVEVDATHATGHIKVIDDAFDAAAALRSLSPGRQRLIVEGAPEGERSEKFHAVTAGLHEDGLLPEQIVAILSLHPAGIASKYGDRLADEVARCCEKSKGHGSNLQIADGGIAYSTVPTGRYKGLVEASAAQVLRCMAQDTRFPWEMGFDEFLQDVVLTRDGVRISLDEVVFPMRVWFDEFGWEPVSDEKARGAAHSLARAQTTNRTADYVSGLISTWDGVDRTDGLLKALGVAQTPYTAAVIHYLITAMAMRAMEPGCQADNMVVLKGPQGAGKSQVLRALAPVINGMQTYREGNVDDLLTEERSARLCRGCLILNLDELRQISKRDAAEIKTAISRSHESYVQKFREDRVTFGRSCVLVGTTNQDEFLDDSTGNRRYFVLETGASIDRDWVRSNCEQLWAQGATWAKHGGIRWREATSLAPAIVSQYEVSDSREMAIEKYSRDHNAEPILIADVLQNALGVPLERQTRQLQLLVGAVLRREGRRKSKGHRHKVAGVATKGNWWVPESEW